MFSSLSRTRFIIGVIFNPFPNKPIFLLVYSTSLLKTLGKGKNCSKRAISVFHTVFKRLLQQIHETRACLGKGLVWERVKVTFMNIVTFAASVDQDQSTQHVQPDLGSTLSALVKQK